METNSEATTNLCLPCLLLDWRDAEEGERDEGGRTFDHICTYKMLLPVVTLDIRGDGTHPFIEVAMSPGNTTQTGPGLVNSRSGAISLPRRDGVHAMRDAVALRLPLYVRYKGEYQIIHIHPQDRVRYGKESPTFWHTREEQSDG